MVDQCGTLWSWCRTGAGCRGCGPWSRPAQENGPFLSWNKKWRFQQYVLGLFPSVFLSLSFCLCLSHLSLSLFLSVCLSLSLSLSLSALSISILSRRNYDMLNGLFLICMNLFVKPNFSNKAAVLICKKETREVLVIYASQLFYIRRTDKVIFRSPFASNKIYLRDEKFNEMLHALKTIVGTNALLATIK